MVDNATFFLLLFHPKFYRSQNISLLWLLGILSQRREKVEPFLYVCFSGGFTCTAFGVLEHISVCITETQSWSCVLFTFCIMSLNFHWSKKWYELFTSCNVFCIQAWHFRNFQIRASLYSPCHYIFRAYTTKNLKETCILQGPIRCCQNVR